MQKVNQIALIIIMIIMSACSVSKRAGRKEVLFAGKIRSISDEMIAGNNLTSGSFYVEKAEIEVSSEDFSRKFLANLRFGNNEYLLSLRSRTGLEAARVYITSDTILVNDRLNRALYYGEPEILAVRYGIPFDILPLILGDFVTGDSGDGTGKCIDNMNERMDFVKGIKLNYVIDCGRGKIISAEREGSLGDVISRMEFSEFRNSGGIEVPSLIKIRDFRSETDIEIRLGRIEKPWSGTVEFVPGGRYDLIELR